MVSPSLDGRGKALHHKGAGQSPVPDWYRGEGDIHPHPTLPHPFATLKGRQGGGNFGCYFFRGLVLYISLVAILLFITETGGTAEKRLPEEADTAAIKTLMKKLERDTQMFEDALEIGDLQELNRLAQELGHTCCQVCTVVTDGLSESETREFKKRAEAFYASIQGLMVFTQQSTLQVVTSHYREVKESCTACHDLFKK